MDRGQIIVWALSKGWRWDLLGHLWKMHNGHKYRLRFDTKKLLYEVLVTEGDDVKSLRWEKVASGAYKRLSIADDDLDGMTRAA